MRRLHKEAILWLQKDVSALKADVSRLQTEAIRHADLASLTKSARKKYAELTSPVRDEDGNTVRWAYPHEQTLLIIKECGCE